MSCSVHVHPIVLRLHSCEINHKILLNNKRNDCLTIVGFLSTEDQHATGNWGLLDQELALEFVKQNIKMFNGDPERITLVGEGTGAASVGLHMVSPRTNTNLKGKTSNLIISLFGQWSYKKKDPLN